MQLLEHSFRVDVKGETNVGSVFHLSLASKSKSIQPGVDGEKILANEFTIRAIAHTPIYSKTDKRT